MMFQKWPNRLKEYLKKKNKGPLPNFSFMPFEYVSREKRILIRPEDLSKTEQEAEVH